MNILGREFLQERKFAAENFQVLLRHIMHKTNAKQKELAEMLGFESPGYVSRLLSEEAPLPNSPALITAVCALARIVSDDRAEFERELHRKPLPTKAPANLPRTGPEGQTLVKIHKPHANSGQNKR